MRRFSPGRCCCTDCQIAADNFSDTDLGDWTEISGSWIDTGGERTTTDAAALIIHDTPHPDGDDQSQVAQVLWRPQATDERARLVLAYENPSNYLFAEIWIDSGTGCGFARLWQRTSAINTALTAAEPLSTMAIDSSEIPAGHTLQLCYTRAPYPGLDQLVLRVTTAEGNLHSIPGDVLGAVIGDQAGLGTGTVATGPVVFDDFAYLYHGDEYPGCPKCSGARDCLIGRDDFARADSTDLGCDWEEEAGDWEIASEILSTSDAAAAVLFQHAHPENTSHVKASVQLRLGSSGDVARIYADWQNDENHHYAELEAGSGCGILRMFKVEGGTPEQLGPDGYLRGLVADEWHAVQLCFDTLGQRMRLVVQPGGLDGDGHAWRKGGISAAITPLAESGYLAGLGTGADALLVEFDGWRLDRLQDATNDTCPECAHDDCTIDLDNFAASGLACVWEQVAGSWSAGSDALSTSSSDAFLLNRTPHPGVGADGGFDNSQRAAIHLGDINYSDVFGLRICYVDEDNYLFARLTVPSDAETSDGILEIGKVVEGVEEVLSIDDGLGFSLYNEIGWAADLEICYDGYYLSATLDGYVVFSGPTPVPLGYLESGQPRPFSVSGVAGVGFGPGLAGIFTEAITGTLEISKVFDYGEATTTPLFVVSHDLNNFNCERCLSYAQCFYCSVVEGEGLSAVTVSKPVNWLAEISGFEAVNLTPENPEPTWDWTAADVANFNDTYAFSPIREHSSGFNGSCDEGVLFLAYNCHWERLVDVANYTTESFSLNSLIRITLCEDDAADPNTSPNGIKNLNLFIFTGRGRNTFGVNGEWALFRKSFPYTRRQNGDTYENRLDCVELFGEDWIELDRWQNVLEFPPISPSNENVRVRLKAIPLV